MFTAALIAAEQYDRRNMLRVHRRHLRDSTDPFEIPEARFRELYRLTKVAAIALLNEIVPFMHMGVTTTYIPQPLRMCAALHFFATGSYYRDIGQDFEVAMSKTLVCRCVKEISEILEGQLMPRWIKFPTPLEYDSIKEKFYEQTGFPGVIGAIDCTHVRIQRPKKDVESCYLNRKGYHSKNVQLICDFNLKIYGGFARFGGAAHDSYIWEASKINAILKQRYESDKSDQSYLLGDSGYALRPWIITPYRSSSNVDEKRFNTPSKTFYYLVISCGIRNSSRLAHGIFEDDIPIDEEDEMPINEIDDEPDVHQQPLREATLLRDRLKERLCRRN